MGSQREVSQAEWISIWTKGGIIMELGIAAGVILILTLEFLRSVRMIRNNREEITRLEKRIMELENLLKEEG